MGGVMDQSETLLRLMVKPPSIYQSAVWHIEVAGLDVTWPQSSKQILAQS